MDVKFIQGRSRLSSLNIAFKYLCCYCLHIYCFMLLNSLFLKLEYLSIYGNINIYMYIYLFLCTSIYIHTHIHIHTWILNFVQINALFPLLHLL